MSDDKDFVRNRPPSYGEFVERPRFVESVQFTLPKEAYRLTERARLMSDAATEGMEEYGLGGLAYAKARRAATVASEARAWQDLNTPEVIPEGSTAIPDVDREIETRPETAERKNY